MGGQAILSFSATTKIRELPRHSRPSTREPLRFHVLAWVTFGLDVAVLGLGVVVTGEPISDRITSLWWAVLVAGVSVGIPPVSTGSGPVLAMDLPVLLAVGFVVGPVEAGLVALVGCFDSREFRRQISVVRALYNRSQTSLAVMAAALVFHAVGGRVGAWPLAPFAATLALLVDVAVNYAFIAIGLLGSRHTSPANALSLLKFGPLPLFALVYGCFGFLGLLLAEIYVRLGAWGLVASVSAVLLARQAFAHRRDLDVANRILRVRRKALLRLSKAIAEERRDERASIAASLHDDVLQALHSVTIHAHVIKEDLRTGRLLELDDDLPGLLRASEEASAAMRSAIRDLRRSSLGRQGLAQTLILLTRHLSEESGLRVEADVHSIEVPPDRELIIYQIAREALTNAVKHSKARKVSVQLWEEGSSVRLLVSDDGIGFQADALVREDHFGLELMRERARSIGGILTIRSREGGGTLVAATLPRA